MNIRNLFSRRNPDSQVLDLNISYSDLGQTQGGGGPVPDHVSIYVYFKDDSIYQTLIKPLLKFGDVTGDFLLEQHDKMIIVRVLDKTSPDVERYILDKVLLGHILAPIVLRFPEPIHISDDSLPRVNADVVARIHQSRFLRYPFSLEMFTEMRSLVPDRNPTDERNPVLYGWELPYGWVLYTERAFSLDQDWKKGRIEVKISHKGLLFREIVATEKQSNMTGGDTFFHMKNPYQTEHRSFAGWIQDYVATQEKMKEVQHSVDHEWVFSRIHTSCMNRLVQFLRSAGSLLTVTLIADNTHLWLLLRYQGIPFFYDGDTAPDEWYKKSIFKSQMCTFYEGLRETSSSTEDREHRQSEEFVLIDSYVYEEDEVIEEFVIYDTYIYEEDEVIEEFVIYDTYIYEKTEEGAEEAGRGERKRSRNGGVTITYIRGSAKPSMYSS
jgi:hypothetical protein